MAPEFEHQGDLPRVRLAGGSATVFAGSLAGHDLQRAQTKIFSPMVGAELRIPAGSTVELGLEATFEHGFLIAQGDVIVDVESTPLHSIAYFEPGKTTVTLTNDGDQEAIVILLGGQPFEEPIVMWWNFIERSHEEIVDAREKWNSRDSGIPAFADLIGSWTPAPDLPNVTLKARL
jgi:redox-sensitive bicupin YhaK (pirin superfamily)